ncbi:tetratricopeptide repeat protein [Anaeromyxobacter dehalogenans]|uniref:Tetratricopeptide repeat protein n=1 Tax=Anaeromyxobacter dehalogenans (strain 2CP-C) TaxID=290397 RepID=Q2IE36_ANADE|nr:tetratricopeptide repeat protein [Anaeromyxobacter dehalogenans]ABC82845.1 tetratricopeptide repeat protein [Anaeromyxobacter dehalogenans 2CP-C]
MDATAPRRYARALPIAAILALGIAAYANALGGPFVLDDHSSIIDNADVAHPARWLPGGPAYASAPNRALTYFTFALNHRLGGLDPAGYKAVNVGIHLAAALLVYALVLLALRAPRLAGSALARSPRAVALCAAALFVAHPLQTQAVTYVVQRLTSLATLLYLASVVLYARWRERLHRGAVAGPRAVLGYVPVILTALLAMRSKEIALTLPLAIAAYELCFLSATPGRRLLYLAPVLATLAVIPMTQLGGGIAAGGGGAEGGAARLAAAAAAAANTTAARPYVEYVTTQPAIIARYLGMVILPVGQSIDHGFETYSLADPLVLLGLAVLTALAGVAAWLLAATRRREAGPSAVDPAARLVAFGVIWFLLGLSLESLVALQDLMVEHRMYLPSAGLFVAASAGAGLVAERVAPGRWMRPLVAASLVVALALAVATFARNEVWADDVRLWADAAAKAPANPRTHGNLGQALAQRGDVARGMAEIDTALRLKPDFYQAHTNKGVLLLQQGQVVPALEHLRTAVALAPDDAPSRFALARALHGAGDLAGAVEEYRTVLGRSGRHRLALNNLAVAYAQLGRLDLAVEHFRKAAELDPEDPEPAVNLGRALLSLGDAAGARVAAEAALRAAPRHPGAHAVLGGAYLAMDQVAPAAEELRLAVGLGSRDPETFDRLAAAYARLGAGEQADAARAAALRLRSGAGP